MKVFVYGTLKRGYNNHRLLEGKPFVGEAVTMGRFEMLHAGFPVLIPSETGLPVKGEVFDIGDDRACLDALDGLEGEGVMYDRRDTHVYINGSEDAEPVSVYIGNPRYWSRYPADDRYLTDDNHYEWRRT